MTQVLIIFGIQIAAKRCEFWVQCLIMASEFSHISFRSLWKFNGNSEQKFNQIRIYRVVPRQKKNHIHAEKTTNNSNETQMTTTNRKKKLMKLWPILTNLCKFKRKTSNVQWIRIQVYIFIDKINELQNTVDSTRSMKMIYHSLEIRIFRTKHWESSVIIKNRSHGDCSPKNCVSVCKNKKTKQRIKHVQSKCKVTWMNAIVYHSDLKFNWKKSIVLGVWFAAERWIFKCLMSDIDENNAERMKMKWNTLTLTLAQHTK